MKRHTAKTGHRNLDHSLLLGFNFKQREKAANAGNKEILGKAGHINNKISEVPP